MPGPIKKSSGTRSRKGTSAIGRSFSFRAHSSDAVTLQDLVTHCDNVQQSETNQYSALCPAHSDSNNSLSFSEGERGKLLVTCHRGCTFDEIISEVRKRKSGERPSKRKRREATAETIKRAQRPNAKPTDKDSDIPSRNESDPADKRSAKPADSRVDTPVQSQLAELADRLGVTVESLERIGAAWDQKLNAFTFPERDASGKQIGTLRRMEDGSKITVKGSKRGLSYASDWRDLPGPIFILEGPTDVAAALSMNLCAIGRPSATGGKELLIALLADAPVDRDIIFVGEMDAKPDGSWPGKESAEDMAKDLAAVLSRPMGFVLPPKGKDLRDFLYIRDKKLTPVQRGAEFLDGLEDRVTWIDPSPYSERLSILSASELLVMSLKPEWLVNRILVKGQPAVIGGPKKSLKTTFAIELALSLVTGMNFLNQKEFSIPSKQKVCLLSGESGMITIQETVQRQLDAKRTLMARAPKNIADFLYIGFQLPRLSDEKSLDELENLLVNHEIDVLIIDPLYLCLLSGNAAANANSLFDIGPLLMDVAKRCLKHNVTPIFVHHFPKDRNPTYQPPELDNLAYAGSAEFARQWMLIGRRAKFEPGSGSHKLWLNVGGSAGFSGTYAVDIDEGSIRDDFTGRHWDVSVRTIAEEQKTREAEKSKREQAEAREKEEQREAAVRKYLKQHKDGDTKTAIAEAIEYDKKKILRFLTELVDKNVLEPCKFKKNNKNESGFKLKELPASAPVSVEKDEEGEEQDQEEA